MSFRTLRYENGVDEQLRAIGLGYQRFDEIMDVISDTLSEHPETFPTIPGTRLSFCRTNEFVGTSFANVPSLAIYFHYDYSQVFIVAIEESSLESYGM